MQIEPLKKRKIKKHWNCWKLEISLNFSSRPRRRRQRFYIPAVLSITSSLTSSTIDIYPLLKFQFLWRLPGFLFSTSRTKKKKQPTYFRVKAFSMWSCDCWSPLTPRYKSLSKRPGLKRAGSRRSGRFVAPITNTSQALWRPSSSANNCDTTLTKSKSSVREEKSDWKIGISRTARDA